MLGRHVQQRLRDVLQIHPPSAKFEFSLDQLVLPHQFLRRLAEGLARERDLVGPPAIHQPEAAGELVVPHVVPEPHLPDRLRHWAKHLERTGHHLRRHVPERVHDPVHVEPARVRKRLLKAHPVVVHRRGEAGQVLHRPIRVQCRIQQRQQPAHAVPHERNFFLARLLLHLFDARRDEVVHVVFEPQLRVFRARRAPVDHEDVVALLHQELHETLARRQVQDVRLAHERHNE